MGEEIDQLQPPRKLTRRQFLKTTVMVAAGLALGGCESSREAELKKEFAGKKVAWRRSGVYGPFDSPGSNDAPWEPKTSKKEGIVNDVVLEVNLIDGEKKECCWFRIECSSAPIGAKIGWFKPSWVNVWDGEKKDWRPVASLIDDFGQPVLAK
ncbi:hypothetical protein COT66_01930 [Candidatus Shapirobacteria bacterium CG09_land_8_20_14_0_10_49_15]|uniref:Twin-arginine translocation signal domain-containing protein n=2 Tax=Candidatus Shapironibacteriota TaxID=1752721 RepID=A0A2M8L7W1_9BACT|nr:MAG: hypothetical protein COT66_01930 [Candidatus Shapirobacteria bacterium CG09_land_8_20_14_0_10_49_15]PJE70324.1 MAG: hypothetical protein COU97_00215 [Candidatus Shapirobacteria bacterium CG10_big_fil_rev_8_21_14_0_10_48_15]